LLLESHLERRSTQVLPGLIAGRTIAYGGEGRTSDINIGLHAVNRSPTGGPNRQAKFGISFFF